MVEISIISLTHKTNVGIMLKKNTRNIKASERTATNDEFCPEKFITCLDLLESFGIYSHRTLYLLIKYMMFLANTQCVNRWKFKYFV